MEMVEFVKLVGTAVLGGGIALFCQWCMRTSQREHDNAAAGNMAIVKLGLMINAYAKYRAQVVIGYEALHKATPHAPMWQKMLPIAHEFDEALKLDLHPLSFLFGVQTVDAMNNLLRAELGYRSLVTLHKAHFKAMNELQEALSKAQMEEQAQPHTADGKKRIDVEAIFSRLPPHLTAKVESLNHGLLAAFDEDEHELHAAYDALYHALCVALGKGNVRRFVIPTKMLPSRLR